MGKPITNRPPTCTNSTSTGYKVNGPAILKGVSQGKSLRRIGKEQGIAHTTVSRFLDRMRPHFQSVDELTRTRSDLFNILHGKSLAIQEYMLSELERRIEEDRDFLHSAPIDQIMKILKGVGTNQAVIYDKLRLEGGLSTSNVSLAGMVTHAHQVSPFDEKTGEFKASVTGPIEKKASKQKKSLESDES